MALNNDIYRLSSTTTAINLQRIDPASFSLQGTSLDPKTGTAKTTYTIASGDMVYPTTAVYQYSKTNNQRKLLIALNSWAESVDTVTGEVVRGVVSDVHIITVPSMSLDIADVNRLVHNGFGLCFKTVTAQVPDDVIISSGLFGLTAALK